MTLDNYGREVAEQVRACSSNDLVESEQYLDLLSGRTFRQTLLVGSERMTSVNRALTPESVARLHFLAPAGTRLERDGEADVVIDAAGRRLTTSSAAIPGFLDARRLQRRRGGPRTVARCAVPHGAGGSGRGCVGAGARRP